MTEPKKDNSQITEEQNKELLGLAMNLVKAAMSTLSEDNSSRTSASRSSNSNNQHVKDVASHYSSSNPSCPIASVFYSSSQPRSNASQSPNKSGTPEEFNCHAAANFR